MLVTFYFPLKVFSFFTSWLWHSASDKCSRFLKRLSNVKSLFKSYFCFFNADSQHILTTFQTSPSVLFCLYLRVCSWKDEAVHDNKIVVYFQRFPLLSFSFAASPSLKMAKKDFAPCLFFIPIVVWFLIKHCTDLHCIFQLKYLQSFRKALNVLPASLGICRAYSY